VTMPDQPPVKQKRYRIPFAQRHIIKENIDKMLKQHIIRPSNSSLSSHVVLVQKKDNTDRFCVDYRRLNNVTVKDVYSARRVDDILLTSHNRRMYNIHHIGLGSWILASQSGRGGQAQNGIHDIRRLVRV